MNKIKQCIALGAAIFSYLNLSAQEPAPKPLYDDPVYHGAADPVAICNKQAKNWWMF